MRKVFLVIVMLASLDLFAELLSDSIDDALMKEAVEIGRNVGKFNSPPVEAVGIEKAQEEQGRVEDDFAAIIFSMLFMAAVGVVFIFVYLDKNKS